MRELQKKLRDLGYDQQLTGRFADRTEANVKAFQRSQHMEAAGYVGPRTRDALLGGSRQPDACTGAFKVNFAAVVCYVFMDHYATRVKNALTAASRQRACLRVTLTRPDISTPPLTFATDNSGRCT